MKKHTKTITVALSLAVVITIAACAVVYTQSKQSKEITQGPLYAQEDAVHDTTESIDPMPPKLPPTLYGVTTESIEDIDQLRSALAAHTKRPITRVVFQQGTTPAYYSDAVRALQGDSYVMGQIYDSTAMKNTTPEAFAQRTRGFVQEFKHSIDIYEIGNELNGEWLGTPDDINEKVLAAYDVVEGEYSDSNLRSAITLNYWPSSNCYRYPWEATLDYAAKIPEKVRTGVDYVFLSFYETACEPRAYPSADDFAKTFNELKTYFPNAKLGIGEIGAQGEVDGLAHDPDIHEKTRIANTYYGMHADIKNKVGNRFVGGYFWWYYYQDTIHNRNDTGMWRVIENNFNTY